MIEKIRWVGQFNDHGSYGADLEGELFLGVEDAKQKLDERYHQGHWRRCEKINAPDGEKTSDFMPAVSENAEIHLWKIVPERLDAYAIRMQDDDAEPHYLPTDGTEPDKVIVIGERSQNAIAYSTSDWVSRSQRIEDRRTAEREARERHGAVTIYDEEN